MDQVAPPDRVEHARRGDEVAVEDFQQRQERAEQDQLRDPVRAERSLEGDLGPYVTGDNLLPRVHVGDDGDDENVEEEAGDERGIDRPAEIARIESGLGLLGSFGDRLEAGHEIRHDLQHQENRQPRRLPGCEQRQHVRRRSLGKPEQREDRERHEQAERHHVLENPARLDAAVVDAGHQRREREADREARCVDRAAADRVELVAVERREDPREQIAGGDRFPRTHNRVGQHHRPAGGEADRRRHHAFGIRDLRAGILDPLDQPAVGVRDRKEQQAAEQKTKDAAGGTAARQPVVHQHEPADADHRAEPEREVFDGAEAAVQTLARHQYLSRSSTGRPSFWGMTMNRLS